MTRDELVSMLAASLVNSASFVGEFAMARAVVRAQLAALDKAHLAVVQQAPSHAEVRAARAVLESLPGHPPFVDDFIMYLREQMLAAGRIDQEPEDG